MESSESVEDRDIKRKKKQRRLARVLLFLYLALIGVSTIVFFNTSLSMEYKNAELVKGDFPLLFLICAFLITIVYSGIYFDLGNNRPSKKFKQKQKNVLQYVAGITISILAFSSTYSLSPSISSQPDYLLDTANVELTREMETIKNELKFSNNILDFEGFKNSSSEGNLKRDNLTMNLILSQQQENLLSATTKEIFTVKSDFDRSLEYNPIIKKYKKDITLDDMVRLTLPKDVIGYYSVPLDVIQESDSIALGVNLKGMPGYCFDFSTKLTSMDLTFDKNLEPTVGDSHSITNKEVCLNENETFIYSNISNLPKSVRAIEFTLRSTSDSLAYVDIENNQIFETIKGELYKHDYSISNVFLKYTQNQYDPALVSGGLLLPQDETPGDFCLEGFHKGNKNIYYHIYSDQQEAYPGKCHFTGINQQNKNEISYAPTIYK